MTQQTTDAAQAAALNGQGRASPPAEEPCEDCVTSTDKALGVIVAAAGIFLLLAGFDRFTGGVLTRALSTLLGGSGGSEE